MNQSMRVVRLMLAGVTVAFAVLTPALPSSTVSAQRACRSPAAAWIPAAFSLLHLLH